MKKRRNEQGFTLVELLIAIAVIGVVFAGSMQILSANVRVQKDRLGLADFQQDTDWAIEQMSSELRNCRELEAVERAGGSEISLVNQNGEEITYKLQNGMIVRTGERRTVALTDSAKVRAERLVFSLQRAEDSVEGMLEDKYPGNKRVEVRYVIDVSADFSSACDNKLKRTVKTSVCTINKWKEWRD